MDINYNVRVRLDQLTGREDVRRKQNSVVISFIVLSSPAQSSPGHVIMKHSTNELNNFLYQDGRQDKGERERNRYSVTRSIILVSPGTLDLTDQS